MSRSHISRREIVKGGTAAIAAALSPAAIAGDPGDHGEASDRMPGLAKLLHRTEPEIYTGAELKYIGMPVGGLFAGTLYLGGDGQLWNWDVFNQEHFGCVERTPTVFMGDRLDAGSGANYVDPIRQQSPFDQRWQLKSNGRAVRFGDIRFRGEYPIGKVAYREADADVEMTLEAFSPFIPLDVESSSFPATTLTFRVTNKAQAPQSFDVEYTIENPILRYSRAQRSDFRLQGETSGPGGVRFHATPTLSDRKEAPILFEDWSSGTYDGWTAAGDAFGDRPRRVKDLPAYMGDVEAATEFVVNSHETRHGENIEAGDAHTGTLTSPAFTIARSHINLRVGGGHHPGETAVNLIIDGKVVRSVTGQDRNAMAWTTFEVGEFMGKSATLQVVDRVVGPWGNISLGEVEFADAPQNGRPLADEQDFGTFAVQFLGGGTHGDVAHDRATIARRVDLAAGETKEVTLVVAWHFPNCGASLPGKRNWYAKRWPDAEAVAEELLDRWPELQRKTRDWNRTWYDSTLPHWFLDRTFLNTSILATNTCHRLDEGRFYFWEGVGCCAGTCTHVYGYAQAVGRVFPEVERYLREEIDFGRAYHSDTGAIDYRAEFGRQVATDGQASCILRAYREHQMSPTRDFLDRIWPKVKGAMQYLIRQDADRSGVLSGPQYNTLDTAWYGEIAWISSLYAAALRAAEAMASEMGDAAFARECGELARKGEQRMSGDLFDGEYFANRPDPAHPEANNTNVGCHIDQVYGQSWAMQVGLPRVLPAAQTKKALRSLFQYNFHEDVWEYRRRNKAIPGGRWYATPKEAGLIMCTFPKGGASEAAGKGGDAWAVGYFNECMTGFEYQVAGHAIAEGLLEIGLKIVYAIHRRYHPSKRNPYNEIECSDHYGRAMASYGAFVSICGFQNDGPRHRMTFHPKVAGPFRAAFINEQGWGTYARAADGAETIAYAFRSAT